MAEGRRKFFMGGLVGGLADWGGPRARRFQAQGERSEPWVEVVIYSRPEGPRVKSWEVGLVALLQGQRPNEKWEIQEWRVNFL